MCGAGNPGIEPAGAIFAESIALIEQDHMVPLRSLGLEPASFDAVIDDEKLARGLGLNEVPSFVLGGNYLFSGAQPTSVMVRALREAGAKLISAGQVAAPAEPPHAPA